MDRFLSLALTTSTLWNYSKQREPMYQRALCRNLSSSTRQLPSLELSTMDLAVIQIRTVPTTQHSAKTVSALLAVFEDTDVDFTNNTREVHARWLDFLDDESDIVEYFWCVGTQPMRDNIRECESTGMRPNGSHYELTLQHGDSYYVTVVACNGAGRCSAAYSDGVTIDTTPPVMEYVRDGIMGPDMDFQVFVDIIFAYFSASDPESDDFEEVTNTTIWLAKFKENTLEIGNKYYATVRATNGAGLLSDRLSSNGIVVGKSEYLFDNSSTAEFFFDTVNVNENGSRKDGGVGKTYGTLTVPEGAVDGEVKLRSYSLDDKMMDKNKTEEGPVSNPKYTRPKQFMLGNYSFVIKALDPVNNTVQEGFKFAKPITIAMFYDVDNLVKANKSTFDASLTCPEPWSHVNRTIKLLTVKVCHLTQFSFLWSFYAQNGLVLFDKNNSLYNEDGVVEVFRTRQVTNLEFPVRRAKGSLGDVTVQWSLYQNESSHSVELLWPTSGKITLSDGQWNDSFIVSIDNNNKKEASESVVWVQLDEATGGAVLASRDQTTAKILIAANERPSTGRRSSTSWKWIVTGACSALLLILIIVILVYWVRRKAA
ncbi:hypothetical protein OS493_032194 [Desmophyllum pertusum]|uniref:Fibronectin type-III domain-containing protein n=1 Tax=Desmophyllum pertusum TaxID=174260 RepID=A0A9X0D6K9_9CNID|nr:hypothetical protein OS493_032194 [Desmophyllum pertusum]